MTSNLVLKMTIFEVNLHHCIKERYGGRREFKLGGTTPFYYLSFDKILTPHDHTHISRYTNLTSLDQLLTTEYKSMVI